MERVEVVPKAYPTNLLQKDWTKRKCFYSQNSLEFLNRVHDLEVRDDDVWVVTLPKCGTTWMQELVWLVMNDYDFEAAKAEHLEVRSPFMEFHYVLNENLDLAFQPIEQLTPPRLIKSHLPLPLLPAQLWSKKAKVIYVYRNPKDSIVSGFYHGRSLGFDVDKTCEQSMAEFIENGWKKQLPFEHVTEFYALRNEPWVFYTSFERMKADLRGVILEVVRFLDKTITETQMQQMLEHLSFESMKNNPMTNHVLEFEQFRRKRPRPHENHNFVRKGQVGGYKEDLSPAIIAKCDQWVEEQLAAYNLTLDELLLTNSKSNVDSTQLSN